MLAFHKHTTRLIPVILFAALLVAACKDDTTGLGGGPVVPSLGSAQTYGILAGSAVTCGGPVGTVSADVGLHPQSAISGFPTCTISGTTNVANPAALAAQTALTAAYDALAALACGTTITADLGGTTLAPGVYCSGSTVGVTGPLTLDGRGSANATFVIRAASALNVANGASVVLIGSAQARNVFWFVGSSASLGTTSAMKGNIVALTAVTLADGAVLIGRALARNAAVTLGNNNTITLP